MRRYAVLGATGSTGTELTKHLLNREDVQLNIYARSASKVSNTFPDLEGHPNATAFIGSLGEIEKFAACLDGVEAIFSTVAQNANEPGCSVACDTAQAIVKALETLRSRARSERREWQAPKLVYLGSASLNPATAHHEPWLVRQVVGNASWYVYEDLRESIEYLKTEAPWLPLVIAAPPAIVHSKAVGFEIGSVHSVTISYTDLAGAMIAMAEQEGWEGKYVGTKSLGTVRPDLLLRSAWFWLLPGNITSFFPWMFGPLKWVGFFQ